ncbi:MAG: type III secretion system chaperone [Puniceicoccales bacterium]|jgi:hypothetical protein|nr:type III secretion system chaperone [Puniceicoccales bacterium]
MDGMDAMMKDLEAHQDIIYVDKEFGIVQFAIEDDVFQIESTIELGCITMSSVLGDVDVENENLTAMLFGLMALNLYNYQTFGLGLGLDTTKMNIVAFRNFYENDLKDNNLVSISEDFIGKFLSLKKLFHSEFQDTFVKKFS